MRRGLNTRSIHKITLSAAFLALALAISIIENYIPPIIPVLPFAKIGFSNIILLICFILLGVWEGYVILIIRCLLVAVFSANMGSLMWSLPAALMAYTIMLSLYYTKHFSIAAISMIGGMIHNIIQMLMAWAIVGKGVLVYLPYMVIIGSISGLVTGLICYFVLESIKDKIKTQN